jgi:hypothetical protein
MNVGFMWAEVELPARKVAWIPRIPGYSGIFRDIPGYSGINIFFGAVECAAYRNKYQHLSTCLFFVPLRGGCSLTIQSVVSGQWSVVSRWLGWQGCSITDFSASC